MGELFVYSLSYAATVFADQPIRYLRTYCTGSRRCSIIFGRVIRVRRFLRPQRSHQLRILKLSIDEPQEFGIDIVGVESHLVFSSINRRISNGPPVAATPDSVSLQSSGAEIA